MQYEAEPDSSKPLALKIITPQDHQAFGWFALRRWFLAACFYWQPPIKDNTSTQWPSNTQVTI